MNEGNNHIQYGYIVVELYTCFVKALVLTKSCPLFIYHIP